MSGDYPAGHRPRRRAVTPDEARIWRAVIRDVAPLPGRDLPAEETDEAAPLPPSTPPPPAYPPAPPAPPPKPRVALPDLSHGNTPGLDRRSSERMKKGDMVIDASLDLHGMTQDSAHGALLSFVGRAYESGRRCVLVITGKGKQGPGILRAQVPRWLNQSPLRERILGFSHARPQHGGEGALYVLIKRKRA
ncbi:Smr/MutS family protein [Magnetospirillum sulfuroxidans]|uniref:Smr/MutS family protein n=1 Tax=Magnetospirillum sulfuroxidans TaxID=611300 RepID=A0ABS5IGA3_9PROT|nr:Smr/MutS family protein [Magnetospirillum sulfuroxidans]MBR9972738.1 Smr/MutS family protein [Magnetospirillum sulfuroxidans]